MASLTSERCVISFAPKSERTMSYDDALLYCLFCRHNGHSDWRLPTYDEWHDINEIPWRVWYEIRLESGYWFLLPVRDIC